MTTAFVTKAPTGLHCDLNDDPAIYVTCLASYNSGKLYGYWINLSEAETKEGIQECIDWILRHSPEPGAEEYAVHDSQGLCRPCKGTEWPELEQLAELAHAYNVICSDQTEWIAYRMMCDAQGAILSEDDFRDGYCGVWESPQEYAEESYMEHVALEDREAFSCSPLCYIDWERVWHEMDCDGWSATYDKDAGGYIITRPT